jgi:flagella basal body P-ring formation protein FlgA
MHMSNATILTPLTNAGQEVKVQNPSGAIVTGTWGGPGTPVSAGNTVVWPTK